MEQPPTFAERLLLARKRAGLEQKPLGKKVGSTGHTIGRLERGATKSVNVDVLRQLARVLHVTTDWLLAMDVLDTSKDDTTGEFRLVGGSGIASRALLLESQP